MLESQIAGSIPILVVILAVAFYIGRVALAGYSTKKPEAAHRWYRRLRTAKWTLFLLLVAVLLGRLLWEFI